MLSKLVLCLLVGASILAMTSVSAAGANRGTDAGFEIERGASLLRSRGGHAAGMVDGVPVVAGGNDWINNSTTKEWLSDTCCFRDGKWVKGPSLPRRVAYPAYGFNTGGLYVAGGAEDSTRFREVYRLTSTAPGARWTEMAPLPVPVSSAAGACAGKTFYVCGGEVEGGLSQRMWSLDTSDPHAEWRECRPLPGVARSLAALVACGRYLYLIGGVSGWSPLAPLRDAYRYDTQSDTWESAGHTVPGYAWGGAVVDDKHLLLAGVADGQIRSDVLLVQLADMKCTKIGDAATPTTTAPLLPVNGHEWWLIGGEPDGNKHRTPIVTRIRLVKPTSRPT